MISEDIKTPLKGRIETSFISTSDKSSLLRSIVYNGKVGNVYTIFEDFRENFDFLFSISSDNTKINDEIRTEINLWFNKPTPTNPNSITEGLRLFSKYKAELFKQGIIKY